MEKDNLGRRITADELYNRIEEKEDLGYFGVFGELGFVKRIDLIKELRKGEYFMVQAMSARSTNIDIFNNEVERYHEKGLDVGKGDAEFGYKMPLPEKGDKDRELIFFRRHEERR